MVIVCIKVTHFRSSDSSRPTQIFLLFCHRLALRRERRRISRRHLEASSRLFLSILNVATIPPAAVLLLRILTAFKRRRSAGPLLKKEDSCPVLLLLFIGSLLSFALIFISVYLFLLSLSLSGSPLRSQAER